MVNTFEQHLKNLRAADVELQSFMKKLREKYARNKV